MTRDVQGEIKETVEKEKVVLYMKGTPAQPKCGFSAEVCRILGAKGLAFRTVDVTADEAVRQGVKVYANWPTIPQLYIGGQFVGGCDIARAMEASGELDAALRKAGAIS